jgi:hypothetical protein
MTGKNVETIMMYFMVQQMGSGVMLVFCLLTKIQFIYTDYTILCTFCIGMFPRGYWFENMFPRYLKNDEIFCIMVLVLLIHSTLDNFNRIWWNFYYSALGNKGDSWRRTGWPFCDQSFGYTTDERGSNTSKNEAMDPHWYKTGCRRSQLLLSSGMGVKDKICIPFHIRI